MAKRFTATEIWSEDWFLEMPNEYKLFWYYMLSECDHAGLFKVNLRSFCGLNEVKISAEDSIKLFNNGKDRIRIVNQSVWFIEDFFPFQYGTTFNINNPMHRGVKKQLDKFQIDINSIRGLKEVILTTKEKDKEKEKDNNSNSSIVSVSNGEGGVGEGGGDEALLENKLIAPKMISVFREKFTDYPIDVYADLEACREISYKIAKWKGWKRYDVVNGKMDECLKEWGKIVSFAKSDSWYCKKSISFWNDKFQDLIQAKNNSNGKSGKQNGSYFGGNGKPTAENKSQRSFGSL